MNVRVSSESDVIKIAAEAIHLLNNSRAANKRWNEQGGYEARKIKKEWEEKVDVFLSALKVKEEIGHSEKVKILINQ